MAGGMPDFAEGRPHVAIDDEQLVLLLVAEMREEMARLGGAFLNAGMVTPRRVVSVSSNICPGAVTAWVIR